MNDERPRVAPRSAMLADLAARVDGASVIGDAQTAVSGVTYDSRQVRPGDLFAALPGSDFDGHRYIAAAIANGAAAVLVERMDDVTVPAIVVPDSRAALAPLATAFYGDPSRELTMIGLTGTDGKTTTSYLVRHILQSAGVQVGLIGTIGIDIGNGESHHLPHQTTPESHLVQGYLREMVDGGSTAAILEATSHGLAMHRLDGVAFTIGGVTNITHEHLEYHKTIENYRAAKGMLMERVSSNNGVVVLNADDDGAKAMDAFAGDARRVWYSMHDASADLAASHVVVDDKGCRFDVVAGNNGCPVSLPMLGEFNVANALLAIGVTAAAGVPIDVATRSLTSAEGVPGRMNRVDVGQPFTVVVDYAHTPESLDKVLRLLKRLTPSGRVIVVSGSAGERDPSKRPLQGRVMVEQADIAIVTSEDPRNEDPETINAEIAAGAYAVGGVRGENVFEITDRREAIAHAFALAAPGDCVLLAGKGHEQSMIWGFEHRPWDEASVAREELAAIGYASSAGNDD